MDGYAAVVRDDTTLVFAGTMRGGARGPPLLVGPRVGSRLVLFVRGVRFVGETLEAVWLVEVGVLYCFCVLEVCV